MTSTRVLVALLGSLSLLGVTSRAEAQDILYCNDGLLGADRMAPAIAAFIAANPTATVTNQTDLATCDIQISGGGWELVIVFMQSNFPIAMPGFDNYVTAGGLAIHADWAETAARATLFGATYAGPDNTTVLTVSDAALAAGVSPNPLTLVSPGWGTFSMGLAAATGGTALATFPGSAAIVSGGSRRTLLNGFLSDTSGTALTALYLNEIDYVLDRDDDGVYFPTDCNDTDAAIRPGVSDTSCDGVDQNCSGVADEGFVASSSMCGVGACRRTGMLTCSGGRPVDSCRPGPAGANDRTCDGVDQDCNGTNDEDFVGTASSCGVGVCARTGTTICVAATILPGCTAGPATGADNNCNGVDEDCDGLNDDAFPSLPTTCGMGACGANGVTFCMSGAVRDSCTPGMPAANDRTCDGIDQDCNGTADEDYVVRTTSCGVGACIRAGATSCMVGSEFDSCAPGMPAADDATCDGVDDDCNGARDEDYAPMATSCGVGACAANGVTSCVSGAVADSCAAGTPAADDATCDDVDDDCSGAADEDFVTMATSCGEGECAATGATSCVSGDVVDSCMAGTMAPDDATCDGVDDDCDGASDEDFAPAATDCGVGACVASGASSCTAGVPGDSCVPGEAAADDATCDDVDDDCDGTTDEDGACGLDAGIDAGGEDDGGGSDAGASDGGGTDASGIDASGVDAGGMVATTGCGCRASRGADAPVGLSLMVLALLWRRRRTG